jgi:hypothetical protein
MKNNKSEKSLPRIISGMWFLNVVGALGLVVFMWYNASPTQSITLPIVSPNGPTHTIVLKTPTTSPDSSFVENTVLVTEHPKIATPELDATPIPDNPIVIGYSVAGRPLEVFRYGEGPNGRMIVAGIHGGNEWNTIKLAKEFIAYIEKHPEVIPKDITLYILPSLNPDGDARAHGVDGRVNDNGVDLNRNWPYKWEKDYDRSSCWHYRPTTAGDYGASEPETAALLVFIVSHPEIEALISYHAAALGIFAGGVPDFKPSIRLAKSIAKVSTYQYPPKDVGCIYTGNLTDWAANTQEIAAVDIELHDFRHTDFEENFKILKVLLNFKK